MGNRISCFYHIDSTPYRARCDFELCQGIEKLLKEKKQLTITYTDPVSNKSETITDHITHATVKNQCAGSMRSYNLVILQTKNNDRLTFIDGDFCDLELVPSAKGLIHQIK